MAVGWPGGGFKVATVSNLNPICIELEFGLSMKTTGETFISELFLFIRSDVYASVNFQKLSVQSTDAAKNL